VYLAPRASKYNAEPSIYKERVFHSRREAQHAFELDLRLRAGEISDWTPQVEIPLKVHGSVVCLYIADFVVTYATGQWALLWRSDCSDETRQH
jgi:hypothetical protein